MKQYYSIATHMWSRRGDDFSSRLKDCNISYRIDFIDSIEYFMRTGGEEADSDTVAVFIILIDESELSALILAFGPDVRIIKNTTSYIFLNKIRNIFSWGK